AHAAQHELRTSDYWKGYDPATAWGDGFDNGMGGMTIAGLHLALLLFNHARDRAGAGEARSAAVALAQLIVKSANGEASRG
ncbi:hypothetical protein, partial [Streptomyces capuensis]|uniref:hypothetical protein n=1 Tax=Streptomyces capuensis TaxID=1464056 RepID=UPI0005195CE9